MKAYCDVLGMKPEGGRLIDFAQFYSVSIINGYLDPKTEEAVIKYLINKPDGIYYTYENCIRNLPQDFESKQASRYLGGIELIAEYEPAGKQLQFVVEWLKSNLNSNGNGIWEDIQRMAYIFRYQMTGAGKKHEKLIVLKEYHVFYLKYPE